MENINQINCKIDYSAGIFMGILCTINGFMFHVGALNLRLSDIPFYFVILYWCIVRFRKRNYYDKNILKPIAIILFIFIWLTITGFINYSTFSEVYKDYFFKFYINKTLWIPIYIAIYMVYGGNQFLKGFFLGIGICSLINCFIVIYEYHSIQGGYLPQYGFLKSMGLYIAEKKNDVINQNMIRPTGLMLDPNYTGGYCGIGIITFDYYYRTTKNKIFIIASLLCMIPMLILFSRTGIFSFVLCYIISFILHLRRPNKYKVLAPYIMFIASISVVVFLSYVLSLNDQAFEMLTDRLLMKDSSAGVRSKYIVYFFEKANITQILLGTGLAGNFLTDFWGYENSVWAPESSILTLIFEEGIVFFIIFIAINLKVFFKLLNKSFFYAIILAYINFIGISYNFLGDRVYYSVLVFLIMYSYAEQPQYTRIKNYNLVMR